MNSEIEDLSSVFPLGILKTLNSTLRNMVITLFAISLVLPTFVTPANAQGRGLPLVRDAEIENLIRDYSAPIFKAAGLQRGFVQINLVNSKRFNAFVSDGRRMFINIGTLLTAETPNEVIGVIAHETGHLAGGHLVRLRDALKSAQAIAIATTLLGAGAAAAGAAAGSKSGTQAGGAILSSGPRLALRSLLAYQRTEELAADRAAFKFLERTGQSTKGMIKTFERFARRVPLSGKFTDPYLLSHPLPRERIAGLKTIGERSKNFNKTDSKTLQFRHDMARAKLIGFTSRQAKVARAYPKSDKSLPAQYARAISAYRFGNPKRAIKRIDALIKKQPKNPYFWELKGQAYLETGRAKKALKPLRKAVQLKPDAQTIRILLGHALVASEDKKHLDEAIRILQPAVERDGVATQGHRQLAIAYGRKGNIADAELTTAEGFFLNGNYRSAKIHAARAKKRFKRGTRGWLRSDDILKFKAPKLRKRRK